MPKFRLLSIEELQLMQKEFIDFLVVNGITADDWESMKSSQVEKAETIIELFSDMVLETVLRKINYIEHRGKNHVHVFQCLQEQLVLVAMEVPDGSGLDFTNPDTTQKAIQEPISGVKVFTKSKPYIKSRELELFDILQSGGVITDNRLFNALCLSL
ncbi:MAG: hypothetical protein K2Q22_00220 [Cytophagales bacterium]|nr:hypothetical protein [Cytophagales bacterium]